MSHPTSTTTQAPRVALILGITGSIGRAVAMSLAARGFAIRALSRDPEAAARRFATDIAIDWRTGDALDADAVRKAAMGASLIFHGVNPPGYARWREDGLPMLGHTIAAARVSGARILFPGNVYVFGTDAGSMVDETAPRHPATRKGAVRLEMEEMLEAAARDGVRSLVLRAGDFFGPGVEGSWFTKAVAKGGAKASQLYDLTRVGHSWAFVPDLAETFAELATREADLPPFVGFHFAGHWIETGRELAEATRTAIGKPSLPIRRFPWILLYLGAPFVTFMREALEMMWLWRRPLRLDDRKLRSALGRVPHTPLDEALRRAVAA